MVDGWFCGLGTGGGLYGDTPPHGHVIHRHSLRSHMHTLQKSELSLWRKGLHVGIAQNNQVC